MLIQISGAGALNEQQAYLLGQVVKQNSELSLLFKDLFAIEDMRRQPFERLALVKFDAMITAIIEIQRAEIERRGQVITTSLPASLSPVVGDEERLGRVLSILTDNAIKYSPAGASIRVIALEQNRHIAIAFHNTGVSLSPEEQERVFEPFYRAPSIALPTIQGRGLGLAIARAIIEGHGGEIWAASPPGNGNMFAFYVPCVTPDAVLPLKQNTPNLAAD
ncbi:MAG: ATP-binding protein [Chloroflexales bacterium]|nr:ATP-binding protein [Chloroflexales bacterium]